MWQQSPASARSDDNKSSYFFGNSAELRDRLSLAPAESRGDRSHTIELPMPDGGIARFAVVESSIMEDALAAKFPEIKTYKLYGVDDPSASGRADITEKGFRAMLQTAAGRLFIDPVESTANQYHSRFRDNRVRQPFSCGVNWTAGQTLDPAHFGLPRNARVPGNYQTYRLAVSATQEYVDAVGGGKVGSTQNEIVTAVNRVNQIYERDLGIRLILVGNNDDLIEQNDSACFTNDDLFLLLLENQDWIDIVVGNANYDIGHVFSTSPSGGLAFIEGACNANFKAAGATGLSNPTGDIFYIDYVAHEIGHQLGADHTFNGSTGSCNGGRNGPTAYEPGSGTTIMAYAGICGAENLQTNSDATFHAASISQIDTYTSAGGNCYQLAANGNTDPTLTGIPDRTIPGNTPFVLDNTSINDGDGDTPSYQWEQLDAGTATTASSFGQDLGDNGLFRSYAPQPQSYRDFPALGTQLLGQFDEAEVIACSDRNINLRLTVRDNASGQVTDDVVVTVDKDAGPFQITAYNTPQSIDFTTGPKTLTWDVANTDNPPVNCANVDIELLTFSNPFYQQFTVHPLVSATANDGSHDLTVTEVVNSHPRARFRIRCSNNVFYDISDGNLNIIGGAATVYGDTDTFTFFNTGSTLTPTAPVCGVPRGAAATRAAYRTPRPGQEMFVAQLAAARLGAADACIIRPSPGTDSSSIDPRYLLLLVAAVLLLKLRRRFRACNTV